MKHVIATLVADLEYGEGELKIKADFAKESPLLRADVLQNCLYDITEAYQKALQDMFAEFESRRRR